VSQHTRLAEMEPLPSPSLGDRDARIRPLVTMLGLTVSGRHCRERRAQLGAQKRLIEAQIGTLRNNRAERSSSQGSGNSADSIEAEMAHQIAQTGLKRSFLSRRHRRVADAVYDASRISLSVETSLLNLEGGLE
jgi:hypothetical protein